MGRAPAEVRPHLDAVDHALGKLSRGQDAELELHRAVDAALRSALASAARHRDSSWTRPFSATFGQVIGQNIKAHRNEAGWTQADLAAAMARMGFAWKRITLAEVEAADRRCGLEELLVLAALFAVPVLALLDPGDDIVIDLPKIDARPEVVRQLLVGRGGQVGQGGPRWAAAAELLGAPAHDDDRPAIDLWRKRSARSAKGRQHKEKRS
jgi:hypothetical protein